MTFCLLLPYNNVKSSSTQHVVTHDNAVRESEVKGHDVVNELDLLRGEIDFERIDIIHQVFDLPASNDRKDVRCLVEKVRNGNYDLS